MQTRDKREGLFVHRGVVALHGLGEGADLKIGRLLQRLLSRVDVQLTGGIGDVGDLRVGRSGVLGHGGRQRSEHQDAGQKKGFRHGGSSFAATA